MATHQMASHQQQHVSPWAKGFSVFAGVIMVLVGLFQMFEGLAAIINSSFFTIRNAYAYQVDITTWGWIHFIVGTIVALAGFAIFSGKPWARALGIILAMISALVNFFYIPYYPFWAILIIVLDIAIMWGLAVSGPEQEQAS